MEISLWLVLLLLAVLYTALGLYRPPSGSRDG
jgi:hypothetical protein